MVRLGLLSDTHLASASARLSALLAGVLGGADILLHAGDYVAEEVVDHLEFVDPRPFYGVAGNCDPAGVRCRLPAARLVEAGGLRVGLTHGVGGVGPSAALFDPPPDLLVIGHAHRPLIERRGRMWVVNPGSAFDRRSAPAHTVAIVTIEGGRPAVRIVEVGE